MSRDMTKPTKWVCAQRSIRPVWSESSLWAQWVAKDPSFLHAGSEDSDQTGRMPRLIWVFAGRTSIVLVLSCRGSYSYIVWFPCHQMISFSELIWNSILDCFILLHVTSKTLTFPVGCYRRFNGSIHKRSWQVVENAVWVWGTKYAELCTKHLHCEVPGDNKQPWQCHHGEGERFHGKGYVLFSALVSL